MLGCHGSLLLLPCSSRRPLGIAPSSARQPLGRFRPSSACRSPAHPVSGLSLPDTPVCCGCRPFQKSPSTHLSLSLGSRMMAKVAPPSGSESINININIYHTRSWTTLLHPSSNVFHVQYVHILNAAQLQYAITVYVLQPQLTHLLHVLYVAVMGI